MDTAELRHTFSTRIRKLREAHSLNQGEFADTVGISRGAMSYYEQEARTPDIGVLRQICAKYGVSADYLIGLMADENHAVSDVCRETALSPKSAKTLKLLSRLIGYKLGTQLEVLHEFGDEFLDVMKLMAHTSVPEMLNVLLENEEGLGLLTLLGAIVFGAEFDTGSDKTPSIKIKSMIEGVEIAIPFENVTPALWQNIQSDADTLRKKVLDERAAKDPKEEDGESA